MKDSVKTALDILVNRSADFSSFSENPTIQKQIKNEGVLLYDKRLLQELGTVRDHVSSPAAMLAASAIE